VLAKDLPANSLQPTLFLNYVLSLLLFPAASVIPRFQLLVFSRPGMMGPAMVQFLSFSHCIFRIFSPLHRRRRRRTTTTTKTKTKQTRYKKQTTKSVNTNYPKAYSAK
jgi:hypothetical protein